MVYYIFIGKNSKKWFSINKSRKKFEWRKKWNGSFCAVGFTLTIVLALCDSQIYEGSTKNNIFGLSKAKKINEIGQSSKSNKNGADKFEIYVKL